MEKERFEEKVYANTSPLSSSLPPGRDQELSEPTPINFYCQVCREPYHNYHRHILTKSHLRNIRASKATAYISRMCKVYIKPKPTKISNAKLKGIKKDRGIEIQDKGYVLQEDPKSNDATAGDQDTHAKLDHQMQVAG